MSTHSKSHLCRRTRACLYLLLLGAAINVAIAWGVAVYGVRPAWQQGRPAPADEWWLALRPLHWVDLQHAASASSFGSQFRLATGVSVPDCLECDVLVEERLFGWPLPSLKSTLLSEGPGYQLAEAEARGDTSAWDSLNGAPPPRLVQSTFEGGLVLGARTPNEYLPRTIPLMPIRSGLFANSVAYAGLMTLLLICVQQATKFRRSRNGQCTMCGYTKSGLKSSVCPECGTALSLPASID